MLTYLCKRKPGSICHPLKWMNGRKGIAKVGVGWKALLSISICVALNVRVNTMSHTLFTCPRNQITKSCQYAVINVLYLLIIYMRILDVTYCNNLLDKFLIYYLSYIIYIHINLDCININVICI